MPSRFTAPSPDLRAWLLAELTAHHVGSANAITWADLAGKARAAGYVVLRDERNLREEVNALQINSGDGALIVASNRRPYGVFVAQTEAELEQALAQLESRIASLGRRVKLQRLAAHAVFRARMVQGQLL